MGAFLDAYLSKEKKNSPDKGAVAYLATLDFLAQDHPEMVDSVVKELKDQRNHIKLIASENYSSLATQLAMGNLLTDKYSEGKVGHRFYAGCENVDNIERKACDELIKIFGCDHAYVQPHSGADANLIAYWAILTEKIQNPLIEKLNKKSVDQLTDEEYETVRNQLSKGKLLGMSLASGGHLTHGYRHNVSSKMMQAFTYDVDPTTEMIDYAALDKQAKEVRPTVLVAGYSAYPRNINFAKMKEIAAGCGATLLVDMAHFSGLVAGKVMKGEYNPIAYADIVTSTTHKSIRGPRGGMILCKQAYAEAVDKGCPMVIGGPLPHVMAAKLVAFKEANTPDFCSYAARIVENAQELAKNFLQKDVKLFTGGTDNHLLVIDVKTSYGLTGRQAETALNQGGLTVNRNMIPFDTEGPWYTSGIRIGTPAITTRGFGKEEMVEIANLIHLVLTNTSRATVVKTGMPSRAKVRIEARVLEEVKSRVAALLGRHPLYPELEV
ncbi:serine hydroxymethyltransferase [Candidatus Aerophobetes bacterium]|uniref:Serine hydroxymethyltransferase n=1 Tax=Aerophobetes bacterium TaxID=2030807 RepID=A0A2A4X733_UNCAE|nr:MAG: serine hydroxymethyltransferase [Candidatus Aerophobetes bacterium]